MSMMKNQPAHGALRAHPARHAAQDAWDNCEAEQAERAPLRAAGFDHAEGVERGSAGPTLPGPLLRRTFEYIERNLDLKFKWDDLAAAVGLEPFRFARGFKRATGMTPHRYVMSVRVRRARELLAAHESSTANVALDVGCSCQSHLTTLFRLHTGTTPAAFRRAARQSRRVLQVAAAGAAATPKAQERGPGGFRIGVRVRQPRPQDIAAPCAWLESIPHYG